MSGPAKALSLKNTLHWALLTLVRMAQRREWGEIRITVQDGQIMLCHEAVSYRDKLPQAVAGVDPVQARQLAAVS